MLVAFLIVYSIIMPTNPFEEILIAMATEIAEASSKGPLRDDQVMSIFRANLNPFPPQVQDKFQSLFNVRDLLNPKQ